MTLPSIRLCVPLLVALSLALSALAAAAERGEPIVLVIDGTNLGQIPDRGVAGCGPPAGPPRNVEFEVAPFFGRLAGLDVEMAFDPLHPWMGDIRATLIAPDAREHVLFGRVGAVTATSCGDSSDLVGPYRFADTATPPFGGFWQAATAASAAAPVESGSYFTTESGGSGAVNPMPPTSLTATFAGMSSSAASGTWILRFEDFGGGDVGTVSAATLRLFVEPPIYDNGPLATGPTSKSGVAAPEGTQWSEVQNDDGETAYSNTLAGVSGSVTATVYRIADDFTVPAGEVWRVDSVVFYAYQTGYGGNVSPIGAYTLRVWDGRPDDPGSSVLCGDQTTNRLIESIDTGLYRIFNSQVPAPGTAPAATRRIWASRVQVPANCAGPGGFTEGTYWLDWNSQIGTGAAHFAPPVTLVGVRGRPGDNARQRIASGWQDVIDVGNPDAIAPDIPLDFPFLLFGVKNGVFRDRFESP
jgi:subtilisin-like proprotein convertase family protein